jgi:hypothetical protein
VTEHPSFPLTSINAASAPCTAPPPAMIDTTHTTQITTTLGIEHTALDHKLLDEESKAIATFHVVHEQNAFPFDELELENDI